MYAKLFRYCLTEKYIDKRLARNFVNTSFITGLFSALYLYTCVMIEFWAGLYLMVFNVVGFWTLPFLLRTRLSFAFISNLYVAIGAIAIVLIIYFDGGFKATILPWMAAIPTLALLVAGRQPAYFWFVVSLLGVVVFIWLEYQGFVFPKQYNLNWVLFFDSNTVLGLVGIIFALNLVFESTATEALRMVEKKNNEISEKNEELNQLNEELTSTIEVVRIQKEDIEYKNTAITDSINYAQNIQRAILPIASTLQKHIEDYFILFKPRDIVSGDLYWFAYIEEERKSILAAIDCTGHGVPGAFMTLIADAILGNIVHDKEIYRADIILNELHKGIRASLKQDETQNRDGMDIALLVIDEKKRQVEYAGAKNPVVYFQDGEMNIIKGDNIPIGGLHRDEKKLFTRHIIPLSNTPTTLYLHTDGYQDQFGGERNRKFTSKRLHQFLHDIHRQDMTAQRTLLDNTITTWREQGRERQIDDILVIGLRL